MPASVRMSSAWQLTVALDTSSPMKVYERRAPMGSWRRAATLISMGGRFFSRTASTAFSRLQSGRDVAAICFIANLIQQEAHVT